MTWLASNYTQILKYSNTQILKYDYKTKAVFYTLKSFITRYFCFPSFRPPCLAASKAVKQRYPPPSRKQLVQPNQRLHSAQFD